MSFNSVYVQTNFIYNCLLLRYCYYCTTTHLHTESETYAYAINDNSLSVQINL